VGDRKGIRGRKGAGLTNLLGGLVRCVCGANMRLVRKGFDSSYLYLVCSAAKGGKCKHRKLHRYQPLEANITKLFGEIAFDSAPLDDEPALRAQLARAKRHATAIENRHARESEAIERGKDINLGAKRRAAVEEEHRKKLTEITELESRLQPANAIGEQITAARRVIAGLDRLSAQDRFPLRAKINAGLREIVRGGIVISPSGDVTINISHHRAKTRSPDQPHPNGAPDGAVELRAAASMDGSPRGARIGH